MPILGLAPDRYPTKPAHFDIEQVIRPNILALHPYRCARDDYSEGILLDAAGTPVVTEHIESKVPRSHWDMLLERRTRAELEELLEERLTYLRARRGQQKIGA